jgi:hypothetical protein
VASSNERLPPSIDLHLSWKTKCKLAREQRSATTRTVEQLVSNRLLDVVEVVDPVLQLGPLAFLQWFGQC